MDLLNKKMEQLKIKENEDNWFSYANFLFLSLQSEYNLQFPNFNSFLLKLIDYKKHNAIVFVGHTGSGKSTLINFLIGYPLLPTKVDVIPINRVGEAVTPYSIEIYCDYSNSNKIRISKIFIDKEKWISLRITIAREYEEKREKENNNNNIKAKKILKKIYQPIESFNWEENLDKLKDSNFDDPIFQLLKEEVIECSFQEAKNHLREIVKNYNYYLLEKVKISSGFPDGNLPKGIRIIDTPGTKDPDPYHLQQYLEALGRSLNLIIMYNNEANSITLNSDTLVELKKNPNMKKIFYIVTNIDPKKFNGRSLEKLKKAYKKKLDVKDENIAFIEKIDDQKDLNETEIKKVKNSLITYLKEQEKLVIESLNMIITASVNLHVEKNFFCDNTDIPSEYIINEKTIKNFLEEKLNENFFMEVIQMEYEKHSEHHNSARAFSRKYGIHCQKKKKIMSNIYVEMKIKLFEDFRDVIVNSIIKKIDDEFHNLFMEKIIFDSQEWISIFYSCLWINFLFVIDIDPFFDSEKFVKKLSQKMFKERNLLIKKLSTKIYRSLSDAYENYLLISKKEGKETRNTKKNIYDESKNYYIIKYLENCIQFLYEKWVSNKENYILLNSIELEKTENSRDFIIYPNCLGLFNSKLIEEQLISCRKDKEKITLNFLCLDDKKFFPLIKILENFKQLKELNIYGNFMGKKFIESLKEKLNGITIISDNFENFEIPSSIRFEKYNRNLAILISHDLMSAVEEVNMIQQQLGRFNFEIHRFHYNINNNIRNLLQNINNANINFANRKYVFFYYAGHGFMQGNVIHMGTLTDHCPSNMVFNLFNENSRKIIIMNCCLVNDNDRNLNHLGNPYPPNSLVCLAAQPNNFVLDDISFANCIIHSLNQLIDIQPQLLLKALYNALANYYQFVNIGPIVLITPFFLF